MNVDLTPVVQSVVGLAAVVVTVLGGIALHRLGTWLGLKADDQNMQMLDDVLHKSVAAGAMKAQGSIKALGWDHASVHDEIVGAALNYAVDKFPGVLKSAGLDPADPATAGNIEDALRRVLPAAITEVANSPATPPAPKQ